jgi:hypothetical protein
MTTMGMMAVAFGWQKDCLPSRKSLPPANELDHSSVEAAVDDHARDKGYSTTVSILKVIADHATAGRIGHV